MAAPRLPPDAVARIARGISTHRGRTRRSLAPEPDACGGERRERRRQRTRGLPVAPAVAPAAAGHRGRGAGGGRVQPAFHALDAAGEGEARLAARRRPRRRSGARTLPCVHGAELGAIGFAPAVTRALLAHRPGEVVVLGLRPGQAFDQTPGPPAGTPLELGG